MRSSDEDRESYEVTVSSGLMSGTSEPVSVDGDPAKLPHLVETDPMRRTDYTTGRGDGSDSVRF